jgi:hypothetical protein
MMQMHFLADEHRRELVDEARSHRGFAQESDQESAHECADNVPQLSILSATQRSAAGIPVTGGRAVRRAVAPRIGAWLIDFGTRLGGATVRTS